MGVGEIFSMKMPAGGNYMWGHDLGNKYTVNNTTGTYGKSICSMKLHQKKKKKKKKKKNRSRGLQ